MSTKTPNNAHQGGIITTSSTTGDDSSEANVQALKELLQKEEKRLSVLKTIHDLQGSVTAATGNNKTSIQGSALNKKGSRTLVSTGSGGSNSNLRSAQQPKHSIVVVPGNHTKNNTSTSSSGATGISSRLQQLVDNIAVDQTLVSNSDKKSTANIAASGRVMSVTTPPVPGLTSISSTSHSSQKHTLAYITNSSSGGKSTSNLIVPQIRPKISNSTNIRSSHEVITISDSPVSKNPPPLLSSSSKLHMTSNGSVQVPTISSTVLSTFTNSTEKGQIIQAAEQSRRYREYLLKQNLAKKNFQKQIERKMVVAPYPKTFRQVWPLIPVHDSGFIRHYGLEAVSHYFDSTVSASNEKTSKMKPICNQCGCDFASAWQIRKSNSKQLLLCESCDFQNLKILQRTKLSNQLKELLEDIKKDEAKFGVECEEARRQVLLLERKAAENPPPLTNSSSSSSGKLGLVHTLGHVNQAILDKQVTSRVQALSNTAGTSLARKQQLVLQHTQANKVTPVSPNISVGTTSSSVIPSILGQRSSSEKKENVVVIGVKRKDPPLQQRSGTAVKQQDGNSLPPSKMCKPGSVLDLTLNRLSKQLITRKLDEHRKESEELQQVDGQTEDSGEVISGSDGADSNNSVVATPPAAAAAIERTRSSRRKGTPKHRLLSGGTAGVD